VPSANPALGSICEFAEYSSGTGVPLAYLLRQRTTDQVLVWSNPTGTVLLVAAPLVSEEHPVARVLDGRLFTPLPNGPWDSGLVSTIYF
jgi:hypothetical protein